MSNNESVFIELVGVSIEDVPHGDEWDGTEEDAATELANDIYQMIDQEYPFNTDGVATCVNTDAHKKLNEALNSPRDGL